MNQQNNTLEVKNIGKSYGEKKVVRDVSFSIKRGQVVGLFGPNGAGKTTCFYMMTGMIDPDVGSIILEGNDITKMPMYKRARLGIGYLPQEASVFRGLTVEENIMAVLEIVEESYFARINMLNELLTEFSISHLSKVKSINLSGGERRRLEIARALAAKPKYMFLDEPLAGIDPIAIGSIKELIKKLVKKRIGVLITDHNVRDTLNIVDTAYVMSDGCILTHGTPMQIIKDKKARSIYLGNEFKLD